MFFEVIEVATPSVMKNFSPYSELKKTLSTFTRNTGSVFLAGGLVAACHAAPTEVDVEIFFLVDVSRSVSNQNFTAIKSAYGSIMTSGAILDKIQSGATGKIAASVMFWSSHNRQSIGVEWMEISDLTSALLFSERINAAVRPFEGRTAIANAIDVAVPLFGTETGGTENGFSSITQIIDIAGDGIDDSSTPGGPNRSTNVQNSSNAAILAGVDTISGTAVNDRNGDLQQYYQSFVIGGDDATVGSALTFGDFESSLSISLRDAFQVGADKSLEASGIPEPSSAILCLSTLTLCFIRRR